MFVIVLMILTLVRTLIPLAVLALAFAQFETHELCGNVLQKVFGEAISLEVTDSVHRHLINPIITQERTQGVTAGSGVVCEGRRCMLWNLGGLGNEANEFIHDHVGSDEILQLVGEQVQFDQCFVSESPPLAAVASFSHSVDL
jgi:hypothetical protein